jgi:hypothetical protein
MTVAMDLARSARGADARSKSIGREQLKRRADVECRI